MAQGRSTKIISMMKWIRTSRLSIKTLSLVRPGDAPAGAQQHPLDVGSLLARRLMRESVLLALSPSFWSRQIGETRHFPAPTLTERENRY